MEHIENQLEKRDYKDYDYNGYKIPFNVKFDVLDNGCWECTSHLPKHGRSIYPEAKSGKKVRPVKNLVYERNVGKVKIPKSQWAQLTISCDNPKCINPEHMIVDDGTENARLRRERGTIAIGESNGRAKLNEEQVEVILKDFISSKSELAKRYKVDRKLIYAIKKGLIWKEVFDRVKVGK